MRHILRRSFIIVKNVKKKIKIKDQYIKSSLFAVF